MQAILLGTAPVIRKLLGFILGLLLLAAPLRGAEIIFYCQSMDMASAECCCKAAAEPCTTTASTTCGCCEILLTASEPEPDATPAGSRPVLEPPQRIDVCLLSAVDPLRAAIPSIGATAILPSSSTHPPSTPLYLTHCVLLC